MSDDEDYDPTKDEEYLRWAPKAGQRPWSKYGWRWRRKKQLVRITTPELAAKASLMFDDKDIVVLSSEDSEEEEARSSRKVENTSQEEDAGSSRKVENTSQERDNQENEMPKKRKQVPSTSKEVTDPDNVPSPDEITQDMLDGIASRAIDKEHDPKDGTTCHQCRKKTRDFKTKCRSGRCKGVRGRFCGPCLKQKYGESAVQALKNPNWICPVCRGICSKHKGEEPTVVLLPTAMKEGYDSAKDYLEAFKDDLEGEDLEDEAVEDN